MLQTYRGLLEVRTILIPKSLSVNPVRVRSMVFIVRFFVIDLEGNLFGSLKLFSKGKSGDFNHDYNHLNRSIFRFFLKDKNQLLD